MAITSLFSDFGSWLNKSISKYNYQVAPLAPSGKPGKVVKSLREYRLQLINKQNDTSDQLIDGLKSILSKNKEISKLSFNTISPNSSKFPSYTFKYEGQEFDIIVARGANKGENFEVSTIKDLASFFKTNKGSDNYKKLINQLNEAYKPFSSVEIINVEQRKGSTKKEGIAIEKLGAIIGDIVLTDMSKNKWYISLKDVNGATFSSYSGASTLFDSEGTIQPNSPGAEFLEAFGVDLNKVQEGFDQRKYKNSTPPIRKKIPVKKIDQSKIKPIMERAWGMNYFYVRKQSNGWKVFWIDRNKLNKLISNISIQDIKYPSTSSKQISILFGNSEQDYLIEMRNSKAGEYPNDVKIKVRP